LCVLPLAACATPSSEPLSVADVALLLERGADDPATLEATLELARRVELPFELPPLEALADPADAGHLRAHVLLNAPALRAARRMWLAAASLDARAATTAALELDGKREKEPASGATAELELTFDLLGLFGTGRAAATRAIATAEQRRALAAVWEAAWVSLHDAERARVRSLASRERIARLRELLVESERDTARIEVLDQRGYTRPDQALWALAVRAEIQDRVVHEQIELALREAELATAAGWRIERARAWLDVHGAGQRAIEASMAATGTAADAARALPADHPALLAARLDHALAEARLFAAAREAVPELRVGPQLRRAEGATLGGVVFGVDFAWPSAVRARVRALEHERAGARERLEDLLLARSNQIAARAEALRLEREESLPRAAAVDAGAAAMWSTARDRFANALDVIDEWSFALEHRVPPLLELIEAREHVELAAIDWSEAAGSPRIARTELARNAWEAAR
jgi:hypothetical protein